MYISLLLNQTVSSTMSLPPYFVLPRVCMYNYFIEVSWSSCHHSLELSSTQTYWRHQTRWLRSRLLSMRAVEIALVALSDQSTVPSQVRSCPMKLLVRRRRVRQQWRSSCFAGRGSEGRVAAPSYGRMRRSQGVSGWGMLDGLEECGRPLYAFVSQ